MPVASLNIAGTKTGLPLGTETIGPLVIYNATSGDALTSLTSLAGDNTLTVPGTQYVGCVIVPPAGNTAALKLKGASGDTGIPQHLTNPSVYSFPAGTTNFILNVGAAGVLIDVMWF